MAPYGVALRWRKRLWVPNWSSTAVTCGIAGHRSWGMIVGRGGTTAVSHLPAGHGLAGTAGPQRTIKECRDSRIGARGRCITPPGAQTATVLGRPGSVFAAPALGRLIRGRVRPLISLAHPAPNQVPRLVRATPPRLVPALSVLLFERDRATSVNRLGQGAKPNGSQQKVSNPLTCDATRAHDAAIREHVTAPVDTARHGLRTFGTKRSAARSRSVQSTYV
jgi:hypothetical protein